MKRGYKKGEVLTVEKYLLNLDQTTSDLLKKVSANVDLNEFGNKAEIFRAALKIGLSKMLGEKE